MSIEMGIAESSGCNYDQLHMGPFVYGCNALALQVCPPDEDGWCNVGAYGQVTNDIICNNPLITKKIALIDRTGQFPVRGKLTHTSIHITEFAYICENDTQLMTIPAAPPTEYDKKIASFILPYIHSGDKVQIGFGGLGEEILANLRDIGRFEIYSEVACESMMPLCREGVLTKIDASSPAACSELFFEFVVTDPRANLHPQYDCVDPLSILKQENIVAINATFMIDLLGQACSEAQGLKPYSGTGGSFAYIYGATRAKNGRSFLCLRSTYVDKNGVTQTNIVPWLPEGSIVTTPKNFVMYVVTEHGIADIFLKTLQDRIKRLITIAHPDFRAELKEKICTTPLINAEDFENLCGYDESNDQKVLSDPEYKRVLI
jgi:acyl-CoA hydrolase